MKLLFERSVPGRKQTIFPDLDVPEVSFDQTLLRDKAPRLPQMAEVDLGRHYTELAKQTHGVNDGFYPLGSCTMKYNPRVNEQVSALSGFTDIHPLQPAETAQGCLRAMYELEGMLAEICGMDAMTLQPAAGAHGEYTGLLLIRAHHLAKGDTARTKIIVPDSAHGTNPASAVMAGFTVVSVPSNEAGGVDLDALRAAVGEDTAGLMLTNPNTLGLFDPNILEICRIVHEAGGLCYYDGANLNAVMGHARPGDMGFDCVHVNLHKTFSTPHGGGGPGSGPVGCKAFLAPYLPGPQVTKSADSSFSFVQPEQSVGKVRSFYGNFLVTVRALAYILTLGKEGIPEASEAAVLNANYLAHLLSKAGYTLPYGERCMHEFVIDVGPLKAETGASAMDVAKRLLDFDVHPPTMYFPLIVHEALMVEPTETESRETLDEFVSLMTNILAEAREDGERLHGAPFTRPIGRPDEVTAARKPCLHYVFDEEA
ncbi:MAG: aminomethyl-transferring glycine dehydrogenase subunit GcvPB [Coriobacteriales bacterium]|nr:aminomethyl-transferring glycine dehydrogenase subunit GcvPB [Coriobacteriales bacterium]